MDSITETIIGCAYSVANELAHGFLKKVYENALTHELRKPGLAACQQQSIKVHHDAVVVGDYLADLLVEGAVLVELKVVRILDDVHLAQCLNYLKASGLKVCLLINSAAPRPQVKRVVNKS